MEREGNFVKIPNNMIVGEETLIKKYGDKSLLVYIYLQKHLTLRDKCYISLANCIEESGYKLNKNKGKTNEQFRNILIGFKKEGIIKTSTDLEKVKINDLIILSVKEVEDKFFILTDEEIDKIMNYIGKEDKLNLLKVFCEIKARMYQRNFNESIMDGKYEVSFPSYKKICRETGITAYKSIHTYIKILVKLNLIRYKNLGSRINTETGEIKFDNNTYAIYKKGWEDEIDGAIKLYKSKNKELGWKYKNIKDNRALAGKKTQILKKINNNTAIEEDYIQLDYINQKLKNKEDELIELL